jgi:uncharacterized protein YcfJ
LYHQLNLCNTRRTSNAHQPDGRAIAGVLDTVYAGHRIKVPQDELRRKNLIQDNTQRCVPSFIKIFHRTQKIQAYDNEFIYGFKKLSLEIKARQDSYVIVVFNSSTGQP